MGEEKEKESEKRGRGEKADAPRALRPARQRLYLS